jgi:hypothetical protein
MVFSNTRKSWLNLMLMHVFCRPTDYSPLNLLCMRAERFCVCFCVPKLLVVLRYDIKIGLTF